MDYDKSPQTMEFTFRKAATDDLDILVEIRMEVLRAVFKLPADADMQVVEASSRRYYLENLPDGGHVAYLVYFGEELAGCGGICFYRTMPMNHDPAGLNGYIMNMYTRPAYRCKGIATQVVELLVGEAHARGVMKITLETTDTARSLYHRAGFADITDEMVYVPKENLINH